MIDTTPSMFAQLYNAGLLTGRRWRVLALGGEACRDVADDPARTAMTVLNRGGSPIIHGRPVAAKLAEHARPVIGRPTCTTRVMDSWLRPVPDGVAGEPATGGVADLRLPGRPADCGALCR